MKIKTQYKMQAILSVRYRKSGAELLRVKQKPSKGQFCVDEKGLVTISKSDRGRRILITYSYGPVCKESLRTETLRTY